MYMFIILLNQICRLPPHYLFSLEPSKAYQNEIVKYVKDQETPNAVSSLFQVESLGPQLAVAVLSHLVSPKSVFPDLDSRLPFLTYPSQAVGPPEEGAG